MRFTNTSQAADVSFNLFEEHSGDSDYCSEDGESGQARLRFLSRSATL